MIGIISPVWAAPIPRQGSWIKVEKLNRAQVSKQGQGLRWTFLSLLLTVGVLLLLLQRPATLTPCCDVNSTYKPRWTLSPLKHALSVYFTIATEMKLELTCTHQYTGISKLLTVLSFFLIIIDTLKLITMHIIYVFDFVTRKQIPTEEKRRERKIR